MPLMAIIRDEKSASIAELAKLTGRAAPNVMTAAALVALKPENSPKVKMPVATVKKARMQFDPYSERRVLELA
jgi:predicted transcriptional regulator